MQQREWSFDNPLHAWYAEHSRTCMRHVLPENAGSHSTGVTQLPRSYGPWYRSPPLAPG
jgi:hypothetical protein